HGWVGLGLESGGKSPARRAFLEMRAQRIRLELEATRFTHEHPQVHRMGARRCRAHGKTFQRLFRREPSVRRLSLMTGGFPDLDNSLGTRAESTRDRSIVHAAEAVR